MISYLLTYYGILHKIYPQHRDLPLCIKLVTGSWPHILSLSALLKLQPPHGRNVLLLRLRLEGRQA